MSAKSSEDGSSSDIEFTDLMEISTVSLLGKRKAETPISDDDSGESEKNSTGEDEDDEEFDEEEESDEEEALLRSKEKPEPEWGNDSSEDSSEAFFETEDKLPRYFFTGVATVRDLDEEAGYGLTTRQFSENLTNLCLKRYNDDKGLNVTLDHIMRVNFDPGAMTDFYITFAAKVSESPDDPLVEYQAKAVWSVKNKSYPIFCRPKRVIEELN